MAINTEHEKELLAKGIAEFNAQEYFDCHETLEELWKDYTEPDREAIQGIIQIAVGYYHLRRGNYKGATKLFAKGGARVERFAPLWQGLDLCEVLQEVNEVKQIISSTDASNLVLDNIRFPVIRDTRASKDC
ncbi:MAG: DUF309 domain-containing protein [Cyanobacteria bacterium TGS_CYA1]|nr:DUF309 domain-containing protein [Cyanobacteria bacterium TGS_CYA1]